MTDTSEEYRLMCTCPEIQKDHELKEGDWAYIGCIFLPDMRWLIEQIGCPVTLIIQTEKTFISSDGFKGHWHGKTPEQALLNAYMIIKHNKVWSTPDSRWELCC